ncbi:MAG TPA: signal peptidase II [Terriglobales bacterium]|nr:signal peptidase II [Terriglobales bacterium]
MSGKKDGPYLLLILALMALDQAAKFVVSRTVALYESRTVVPGFFNLTRIHNRGAIFGAFNQSNNTAVSIALTAASVLALGLVVFYFIKTPASDRLMKVSLSLILAGALGNLLDRFIRGYVIDFLDFHIGNAHWPFFNVADSCITIGAVLMVVIFFRRKPECTPSSSSSAR